MLQILDKFRQNKIRDRQARQNQASLLLPQVDFEKCSLLRNSGLPNRQPYNSIDPLMQVQAALDKPPQT
jgi:hypothetical protein